MRAIPPRNNSPTIRIRSTPARMASTLPSQAWIRRMRGPSFLIRPVLLRSLAKLGGDRLLGVGDAERLVRLLARRAEGLEIHILDDRHAALDEVGFDVFLLLLDQR